MNEGTGLAEALLGLDGFQVLKVTEMADELVIEIETTVTEAGCRECGTRAEAHERTSSGGCWVSCRGLRRPAGAKTPSEDNMGSAGAKC